MAGSRLLSETDTQTLEALLLVTRGSDFSRQRILPTGHGTFDRHEPHAQGHGEDREIVVTESGDGPDYQRVCIRHQWASLPVVDRSRVSDCVECAAEIESAAGRARYRRLHGVADGH